jgi:O-antigen/teichoic acid export membrane protein
VLRETWSYSAANYLGNCLNLVPVLAMPLAVMHGAGPAATAAFFVAFQVVTILNSGSYAVCEAMLAEGAHNQPAISRTARRAAALMLAVTVPGGAIVILAGSAVLSIFGAGYRASATGALTVLTVSALAVTVYSWGNYMLKITGQLRAILVTNLIYAGVIVALSYAWSDQGPVGVAWAWGAGNLAAGTFAVCAFLRGRTRQGGGDQPASAGRPSPVNTVGAP